MLNILKLNEINNLDNYIIITPSYKELYYKEKYIDYNYNITNFKNFILDCYNKNKKIVNNNLSYIFMNNAFNNVKHKLNYYNDCSNIIKNLVNTYDSFYEYDFNFNDKINDLKIIYNEYESILLQNNYISKHMLYDEVIKNVNFNDKYIFLDFNNFSDDELKIINKISENNDVILVIDDLNNDILKEKLSLNISENKLDFNNKTFSYKVLNDISDEVSFVSNDISKKIIAGANYSDILIVTPDINVYYPYFDLYLKHPHLNSISNGILTSRFVNLFCDVLMGDFSCSKFMELLKLDVFDIDLKLVDMLDNYIFSWNLEKEDFYITFKYNPNKNSGEFSKKDMDDLKMLNDAKNSIIMPLKYLLENIVGTSKKVDILKILYTYLTEEKIIKNIFSVDEEGINSFINLLEDINEYANVNSLSDILSIIKNTNLISNKKLEMQDSISICDFKNAVYENKKYVYIMSMTSTNMPYKLILPNLLSSDDIKSKCLINKLDENEKICYHLFSKALNNENVYITLPKLGPDLKLEEKSMYLNDIKLEKVENIKIYDKNEFIKNYSILLSDKKINKIDNEYFKKINDCNEHNLNYKLDKNIVNKLYGNELNISPSSIETFFKCPFYHFCQYGLKLKPKEKYTFDNRELGTFIHYILESIIKNDINEIDNNNLELYISKYSKEYLIRNGKISNNTTNYIIDVLSKNASLVIKNIIKEMDVTKFRPKYFEFKINDDSIVKPLTIKLDSNTLKVGGIIDRVDTYEDDKNYYYRIIDYKTGDKKFRLDDVLDGLNLQMLIYLLAIKVSNIKNKNIIPSALLYYPALVKEKLSSRKLTNEQKESEIVDRLKMNGIVNINDLKLIQEDGNGTFINITTRNNVDEEKVFDLKELDMLFDNIKDTLRKMGNEIYNGNISVNPIGGRNDACLYCKYKSICMFIDYVDKKRIPSDYKNSEVFKMLEGDNNA